MTQPVSVMRWDDTGAPDVVDGKPSEYLTVLKKCLVDGYGATPGLNWIVVVDEILTATPLLVLKNDVALGGSGGFIVFQADNDTAGTNVKVQCCQAYIDRDTLTNPGAYFAFGRYTTSSFILNKWMLIGTETGFYFFVTSEGVINDGKNAFTSYGSTLFWVGDFHSFTNNDPAKFITMSGSKNSESVGWTSSLTYNLGWTNTTDITDIYAIDGSNLQSHSINSIVGRSGGTSIKITEEPNINALCECYFVNSFTRNLDTLNDVQMPYIRGKVPGLYFSSEVGFYDNAMPFIKEIDGVNYFNIPSAHSYSSAAWINLEEW